VRILNHLVSWGAGRILASVQASGWMSSMRITHWLRCSVHASQSDVTEISGAVGLTCRNL
jgi:hypothetical protein